MEPLKYVLHQLYAKIALAKECAHTLRKNKDIELFKNLKTGAITQKRKKSFHHKLLQFFYPKQEPAIPLNAYLANILFEIGVLHQDYLTLIKDYFILCPQISEKNKTLTNLNTINHALTILLEKLTIDPGSYGEEIETKARHQLSVMKKETKKIVSNLTTFLKFESRWQKEVEPNLVNIFQKNWQVCIPIICQTAELLGHMIMQQGNLGKWEKILDIDGKRTKFFTVITQMFHKYMQNIGKDTTELSYLKTYVELLEKGKYPSASNDLFQSLKKRLTYAIDPNIQPLSQAIDSLHDLSIIQKKKWDKKNASLALLEKQMNDLEKLLKKNLTKAKQFETVDPILMSPIPEIPEHIIKQVPNLYLVGDTIQVIAKLKNSSNQTEADLFNAKQKIHALGIIDTTIDDFKTPDTPLSKTIFIETLRKAYQSVLAEKELIRNEIYEINQDLTTHIERVKSTLSMKKLALYKLESKSACEGINKRLLPLTTLLKIPQEKLNKSVITKNKGLITKAKMPYLFYLKLIEEKEKILKQEDIVLIKEEKLKKEISSLEKLLESASKHEEILSGIKKGMDYFNLSVNPLDLTINDIDQAFQKASDEKPDNEPFQTILKECDTLKEHVRRRDHTNMYILHRHKKMLTKKMEMIEAAELILEKKIASLKKSQERQNLFAEIEKATKEREVLSGKIRNEKKLLSIDEKKLCHLMQLEAIELELMHLNEAA